jgi:hypothetical protein
MAHAFMRHGRKTHREPRVAARQTLERRSAVPTCRNRQGTGRTGRAIRPVGVRALSSVSNRCAWPHAHERATDAWRGCPDAHGLEGPLLHGGVGWQGLDRTPRYVL